MNGHGIQGASLPFDDCKRCPDRIGLVGKGGTIGWRGNRQTMKTRKTVGQGREVIRQPDRPPPDLVYDQRTEGQSGSGRERRMQAGCSPGGGRAGEAGRLVGKILGWRETVLAPKRHARQHMPPLDQAATDPNVGVGKAAICHRLEIAKRDPGKLAQASQARMEGLDR
jgi:hypothetical protein